MLKKLELHKNQEKLLIGGILISLFLIYFFHPSPKHVSVSQIDQSLIKDYIKTQGKVQDLYKSSEVTMFDLTKSNKSVKVVAFKKLPIDEKDKLEVIGQVKLYNKELEVVLEELNEIS